MAVYLKIIHGVGQGQVLPVPNDQPVTIGRSSQASYAFDDALLSRKHCQIECRGNLCRIVDLQSRNGTFVNGQRIGAQLVKTGDRIKVGSLFIEVAPATAPIPGLVPPPAPPPPIANATHCEACKRPLGPQDARSFKNRIVCPRCLDRYDVEEDLIDGFQILERISTAGTGSVYKAKQLLMGRFVVLKTIVTTADTDEKSLKRFMREAKAGGRLSHPSIVELYDVNEQDDLMYIVTEFVEGESLQEMLQAAQPHGLAPGDVVRWMGHIADALNYAHSQSIIHRDVKPATILVRREDSHAKLSDFTLAKNLERVGLSAITADGEAVGTPFYMPPEQVRTAKAVDVRSDVYSFGAAFYHVLTGKFPIQARSYGEFIAKVFTQPPVPMRENLPQLPAPLAALVEKCLSKDPSERFQSMGDVLRELTPIARAAGA
ncbi:protein kinase [bacterium]|nr:protein kinase [bacterium]